MEYYIFLISFRTTQHTIHQSPSYRPLLIYLHHGDRKSAPLWCCWLVSTIHFRRSMRKAVVWWASRSNWMRTPLYTTYHNFMMCYNILRQQPLQSYQALYSLFLSVGNRLKWSSDNLDAFVVVCISYAHYDVFILWLDRPLPSSACSDDYGKYSIYNVCLTLFTSYTTRFILTGKE